MKSESDANRKEVASDNNPYARLGAGRLTAAIWKSGNERRGWNYRFNLFRMSRANGRVSQRFTPRDVADLAKIAQLLAFALADDGCLESELRDDLACLACCLEDVLPSDQLLGSRRMTPTGPAAKALQDVLDYLWSDKSRDFRENPSNVHIYRRLVVLDAWLAGVGAADGSVMQDLCSVKGDDRFGLCPICGGCNGYINVHKDHWFVCDAHRLRWLVGRNLFTSWRDESPEQWQRNWERISKYRVVEPCFTRKCKAS